MSSYRPDNTHAPRATSPTANYSDGAANDGDFRRKPLAVAIDELGTELAQSGAHADAGLGTDRPGFSDEELVRWVFDLSQAPPDLPDRGKAFSGFAAGLKSLSAALRACTGLSVAIEALRTSQVLWMSESLPMARPLAGRRQQFLEYDFLLRLADSKSEGAPKLGAIVIASLLTSWLAGGRPDRRLIKRASEQLAHEDAQAARSAATKARWSRPAQAGALAAVRDKLIAACKKHYQSSARLGLASLATTPSVRNAVEPLVEFNRKLAKRWSACADYMSPRTRQGTLGHGTLTVDLTQEAGRLIRTGAESGDMVQVVMSIEAMFNITIDMVGDVLVLAEGQTETPALLAVSLDRASFRVDMSWLIDGGASPSANTAHLYENTSRVYWIPMAPWQIDVLNRQAVKIGERRPQRLNDLIGDATHHPKTDVLGGGGAYVATVHRLRASLSAIALEQGVPRMIVALTLMQPGLVSTGRSYYGMVTGSQIDSGCTHIYRSLRWLGRNERLPVFVQLCGARVVSTRAALNQVFASLARSVDSADTEHRDVRSLQTWVARHRAIVATLAAAAEFCLCLRESNCYVLDGLEMTSARRAPHVNDKAVHPLGGGPASGKPAFLVRLIRSWLRYLNEAKVDPLLEASSAGRLILVHIQEALEQDGRNLLFGVDLHGNRIDVGDDAWLGLLPVALRLVENFGRHFWPCVCHDNGLGQRHLDYLLRHRLQAWEHQTSVDPVPSARVRGELMAVLDKVIGELGLAVPAMLREAGDAV